VAPGARRTSLVRRTAPPLLVHAVPCSGCRSLVSQKQVGRLAAQAHSFLDISPGLYTLAFSLDAMPSRSPRLGRWNQTICTFNPGVTDSFSHWENRSYHTSEPLPRIRNHGHHPNPLAPGRRIYLPFHLDPSATLLTSWNLDSPPSLGSERLRPSVWTGRCLLGNRP